MQQPITKQCLKCSVTKAIGLFYLNHTKLDGRHTYCKQCISEYDKKRREDKRDQLKVQRKWYRDNNKEIIAERKKKYSDANKDKKRDYDSAYREINKDILTDKKRKYYHNNKNAVANSVKRWLLTDKGKASKINTSNRRRHSKCEGDVTSDQMLMLQQNAKVCYWCNISLKNVKVHIDHYVPLSKGGEHTISNLVVTCAKCNLSKSAKDPIAFANTMGRLL